MSNGQKEVIKVTVPYIAGGAIVANTFVMLDSNGEIVQATDGAKVKGVAMEAGSTGDSVSVALQNSGNIVRVASGAAVTQGGEVASDSNGKAIDAATGDMEVGQADEGSGALDVFTIVHLVTGVVVLA